MSRCSKCGYFMKGDTCPLCDPVPVKEDKPKYKIAGRSKKGKKNHDEDIAFYYEIWEEREHKSEVSGKSLGDEFNVCFFSHVLAKGAFPRFRHKKENIVLMTFDEHHTWEFGDRRDPKFNKVKKLLDKLIIEYYKIKL
jgi:hypothetical protein